MDTLKLRSDPQFDEIREAFIQHYITIVNEAIEAEGLGLKTIDPQDFAILTRQDMREFAKQVNGTVHPEMADVVQNAFRQMGQTIAYDSIRFNADTITIPGERNVILMDSGGPHLKLVKHYASHPVALVEVPGMCHEAVHYSTQTRYFGNDSPLATLIKSNNLPLALRGQGLPNDEQKKLEERIGDIIRSAELDIRVNGAAMYVRGRYSDGKLYGLGMLGYNFEEALAEWFSDKLKRKALNLFFEKHRSLFPKRKVKEGLLSGEYHSASGVAYTTERAKMELKRLGLADFQSALRAYLASEIPVIFAEKNPGTQYYF